MTNTRKIQLSFSGGEITPEMMGRIDDGKYQSGLAKCRNFIIKPQGPAENRPGFQFVREVKDSSKRVRLIPFVFNTTDNMVIECGEGYFRFHTKGATLMNVNVPYEIANPYSQNDLFDIHYVQSADVLTLVHPNYPPKELRRYGALDWRLVDIAFGNMISAPSSINSWAQKTHDDNGLYRYRYCVTAVAQDGVSESGMSNQTDSVGNLYMSGNWNTIEWSAVSGAKYYNVYRLQGGIYGFIGQTTGTSIKDENIAPDMSITPPYHDYSFGGTGNYPGAVSYYEQRRCFAGTKNSPQNLWMTKSGTESNMAYSLPTRDDDRVAIRVAAREANTIRHIVPLTQLLLLTSSTEWLVTSANSDAITPSSISVRPQSYIGASNVQPVIINNSLIYCASRGGRVRELAYNWQANGYVTGDLSIRAGHLFDSFDIEDMAYAKAPVPVVWFISSSGKLLGLTYVPEQQIGAWHWHDTDGKFESCAVVAEGKEDHLYCVVQRHINGRNVRYIERMADRGFDEQEDAFFVDCGLTYEGQPNDTISGLDHLEGKTVSVVADGDVHPQLVVKNGSITLNYEASKIHIGLPIEADLQTMPFSAQVDYGYAQGRYKNVKQIWLRVYKSSGIFAGPNENNLVEAKQRSTEPYGDPPALKTEEIPLVIKPLWDDSGSVFIRQKDPLPLTVVSLTMEVTLGA